jgi:uncharacterized protein
MKNKAPITTALKSDQAKRIALNAQGLFSEDQFGKNDSSILKTIQHLSYVQLDTLAVVNRAHHHILWSRNSHYVEEQAQLLMKKKLIFEYWSHAAAYLPMDDFRFSLIRKQEYLKGRSHWFSKDKKTMAYVLDRIKSEGPLQSKDFETDRVRGSWFDWKPAKIALEQLFHDGTLMVSERRGFQKVYELTERIVPSHINTSFPSEEEYAEHLIRSCIRAHGIATIKDMTHLRRGMLNSVSKKIKQLIEAQELSQIEIENSPERYFANADSAQQIKTKKSSSSKGIHILSPFDNAIIRRDRLKQVFGYDFAIECYLPEPKRKYGYFCLPVLYNGNFIGRFDPKADKQNNIFNVKHFYLEHKIPDAFYPAFAKKLKGFAKFNGCDEIVIAKTNPAKLKAEMKKYL